MKYQSHLALSEQTIPASGEWDPPTRCWCVLRVAEGQGYWLSPEAAQELNSGDVLVLSPTRKGLLRASQLGALQLAYFRFCPDLMSEVLTMSERQFFDRASGKAGFSVRILSAANPVASAFASLCNGPVTRTGLRLRCQLLELVGRLFERELAPPTDSETLTLSATKRIKVLLDHLTEEEFLSASSDQLAEYCGCSLRHFSRLFLQYFGVSLRSRQTEIRLLKARRLLAETDSRVMTVAAACGYRHLGVFNALFKKRFSVTPTEWRRTAAQDSAHERCRAIPGENGSSPHGASDSMRNGNGSRNR